MESNNNQNNNNNDGGDKLANDEDKPAATRELDQNYSSNKNLEEGNDLDLEVCTYLD
jgi:hypothetical protein